MNKHKIFLLLLPVQHVLAQNLAPQFSTGIWFQMGAILLFFLLLFVLLWAWRRGFSMQKKDDKIRVLSSRIVGQRERLCLVTCHKKELLIGITAQQITLLSTVNAPEDNPFRRLEEDKNCTQKPLTGFMESLKSTHEVTNRAP